MTGAKSITYICRLYHGQAFNFEFIECRSVMFKLVRAEQPGDGPTRPTLHRRVGVPYLEVSLTIPDSPRTGTEL
jgi:hypothetical protein